MSSRPQSAGVRVDRVSRRSQHQDAEHRRQHTDSSIDDDGAGGKITEPAPLGRDRRNEKADERQIDRQEQRAREGAAEARRSAAGDEYLNPFRERSC